MNMIKNSKWTACMLPLLLETHHQLTNFLYHKPLCESKSTKLSPSAISTLIKLDMTARYQGRPWQDKLPYE